MCCCHSGPFPVGQAEEKGWRFGVGSGHILEVLVVVLAAVGSTEAAAGKSTLAAPAGTLHHHIP